MGKQEISIPMLAKQIPDEATAYKFLESLRWTSGIPDACPQCGGMGRTHYLAPKDGTQGRKTRTGANSQRRVWFCGHCRKQFSVLAGTIFHGTKISIRTWLFVIFEMCASKNGVSAREIERKYDLTAKSAWFLLHRVREAMKPGQPLAELMRGTIVADETWIGGKDSNRHADKRNPGSGPGVTDKRPSWRGLRDPRGRSRAVPDVTGATLAGVIADNVNMSASQLWTDGSSSYRTVGQQMGSHRTVDHSLGEYKRDGASTNLAEGYFSQLKRSIDGTHHHVSVEHLPRYLAQFDFMYSNCRDTDTARMSRLLGQVDGRRLTYQRIG